jgi:hypothetical protein
MPLPRRRRASYFVYGAVAALLLAVAGLSLWAVVNVQQERQRIASLERRLEERELALANVQRSLAQAGRQLDAAHGRIQSLQSSRREDELAARVAELTSKLEKLRRTSQAPHDRLAAISTGSTEIGLTAAPRFVLRGEEPSESFLRGGGAVNPVQPQEGRITVALDLADSSTYPEVRLELVDRKGKVLWSGRRPGTSVLGDAGTSVTLDGLASGRYHLRVEGLQPDRTRLLAEYLLDVKPE